MHKFREHINTVIDTNEKKDAAIKYLDVLRGNLRECVAAFDRRIQALIIAMVTLELIAQSAVSEYSFGGVKFSNLSILQKMLPCAIAYLYYSLMTVIGYRRLLEIVNNTMMEKLFPEFYSNDLELYAHPPTIFHFEGIIASNLGEPFNSFFKYLNLPLQVMIAVGPAVYLIYAEYRSFDRFGSKDLLLWIALAVTLPFLSTSSCNW